jgi:hypothetical protein
MKKSFVAVLLFGLFYINASAQQPCNCPTPMKHYQPHSRNEIGISAGALYSPDHEEWGTTAHIHYFRTLSRGSNWSLGGLVEQAWLDGVHWTFAAGVKFEPFDHFSLSLLPGVKLLNHDSDKKTLFSLHFEAVYDLFHWKKFHLGPAIDYAYAKNHNHFMIGIHGAFSF